MTWANQFSLCSDSFHCFENFFSPSFEAPLKNDKDIIDHLSDYAATAGCAWDILMTVDYSLSNLKLLASLSKYEHSLIERVSKAINTVGIGLSIPALISEGNDLRHSVSALFSARELPDSDSEKTRRLIQSSHDFFLKTMSFSSNASQAILFLDQIKIFAISALQLRVVDGVYYITSAIYDGFELAGECVKIKTYDEPAAHWSSARITEKKRLSWMIVAKDLASVAISALAVVGLAFASAGQLPMITAAGAVLSAFWLVLKVGCYFYSKIVVEVPESSRSNTLLY